jgi:predicted O-methyltransferase YrrM
VLDPREPTDHAVVEFNRNVYETPQFFTTLVPIRDGLTISLKL